MGSVSVAIVAVESPFRVEDESQVPDVWLYSNADRGLRWSGVSFRDFLSWAMEQDGLGLVQ